VLFAPMGKSEQYFQMQQCDHERRFLDMIKEDMAKIIEERKKKHIEDDYGIQECWEKIIDILSSDVQQTVVYLENCTQEELYYISELFEDISQRVQSPVFIECLRKLDEKFPELEMTQDIDLAESYI